MIYGMQYAFLTLILIILGMLFKNWQPPIKHQYIVIMLLVLGSTLGFFLVGSWKMGFCIAGLVFYKDELVEEGKLVAKSYKGLKNIENEL